MRAMDEYGSFIEHLKAAKTFVIASHYSPDGDGIGSSIALGMSLRGMGKDVVLYSVDPVPWNLKFLPGTDGFVSKLSPDSEFDMAIMVDCAQRGRVSEEFAKHKGFRSIACIDHHKLENSEATHLLLDDGAASTGEVVMRLIKKAGVKINAEIAQLIYTTLVVDTGFFKYSTTDAHVLAVAAELVEAGAEPWVVAKHLEESFPASRLKLLAKSLSTLTVDLGGRYSSMDVTQSMLEATGASMEQSDEFATYPRMIDGVEVAALFREVEGELIKISLRSKDFVDVSELARSMGGGGHSRAAGIRMRTSIGEAKKRLRSAIEQALGKV
jgi:phosphoesterase RecJ-like protein